MTPAQQAMVETWEQELAVVTAALDAAMSGRGQMVMLSGEPGIGQTRTVQELATYAGLRGAQALWGRSYEEQGMPPYWPWVQAIRSYVREREPEQLRSEMGAGAPLTPSRSSKLCGHWRPSSDSGDGTVRRRWRSDRDTTII